MIKPESWPKRAVEYGKENPHLAVTVGLFSGGGLALALNITPLAGALFGAGGALLGAWITELNKRRTDAQDKAKRQAEAVEALSPELLRIIERVQYIVERASVNFGCESSINGVDTKDRQIDFRPYRPTLYPNAPQVRELPGEKAIALIRFYDSLNEIETLVDDWWEREGQLAVNIFNVILHAGEKSLRLGLICIREFGLEARFPPPYESWGTLTSRIERSLSSAAQIRQHHIDRAEVRRLDSVKSKESTPYRTY